MKGTGAKTVLPRLAPVVAALALAAGPVCADNGGILTTKHNLSIYGPGEIKATKEERVCIFCHTPHHASPVTPLWSRPLSTTVYDLYQSTTMVAKPGQPSGASRLCLSCHDGTIAMGALYGFDPSSNVIPMAGGVTTIPVGHQGNLGGTSGKDLTNDHPISFPYTDDVAKTNGQLKSVSELPPAIRLEQGLLQCTSCHNPHKSPYDSYFLVMSNAGSALCTACHAVTGWSGAGHATNAATAAGCGGCHMPHNGTSKQRLLAHKEEEQNCLPCHQPSGSGKDIQSQLSKSYTHPVALYTGVHDEAEDPLLAQKHVECDDCHNTHQSTAAGAAAPAVNGALAGVRGITANATPASPASYEYEICFRCHADNNFSPPQTVVRQVKEANLRLMFSTTNPSYHPVVATGRGVSVPSLRSGYSTASRIYCCDCHGSDGSVKAGGTGPNGPHGSIYPHILMLRYETESYPVSYQTGYYALCYRCHDDQILLDPARSAFSRHQSHVVNYGVPCSVCHDPHGVSSVDGATSSANAHLINFDTRFVTSGSYNATTRSCTVSCHAANPKSY